MKHGKAPTVEQKKWIRENRLVPENWLVVKDNSEDFVIVNRASGRVRTLPARRR